MNALTITKQQALTAETLSQTLYNFDQAAARFLATRANDRTRQTYAFALNAYRAMADRLNLDPFKADCIISFNAEMQAQRGKLANDTIRLKLSVIQALFSWLYTFNLTSLKPGQVADMLTMPPAKELSPRDILTSSEVKQLLAAANTDQERCLIRCMLDAGLRVSEALALRAGDVYAASDRYYIHIAAGKGDKVRDVEIPASLYQDLRQYAQSVGIDLVNQQQAGRKLFADLYRMAAWRIVTKTAAAAGIAKNISPHSLRHTHGHHLRLADYPLELVQKRLGHSSPVVTTRYTRPAEMEKALPLPAMPW